MGSPLGPIMANAFMCSFEENMLEDCPLSFRPLFYKRYVDDTIALFRTKEAAERFLEYMNRLHPNIKFTIEHEHENQLPFLDILITRTDHGFSTNVFRKKTFTCQGTNFYSSCPLNFKLNSISTLIHRAYTLCSSWENFHNEVLFLFEYFKNNSYPSILVDKFLRKFLDNKFQPPHPKPNVPKLLMYATIPFVHSTEFKNQLKNTITKTFPAIDIRLVSRNTKTLGSMFSYKDKLPTLMRSLVVYCFSCPKCNIGKYVGATKRLLKVRINSHQGVSHRTHEQLKNKEFSNIRKHCKKCNISVNYDDFEIVAQAQNQQSLYILESLTIEQRVPSLNDQSSSTVLHVA